MSGEWRLIDSRKNQPYPEMNVYRGDRRKVGEVEGEEAEEEEERKKGNQ